MRPSHWIVDIEADFDGHRVHLRYGVDALSPEIACAKAGQRLRRKHGECTIVDVHVGPEKSTGRLVNAPATWM